MLELRIAVGGGDPGREIRISEETLLIRARWQAACGGFPLQMWQQKKRMANAPSDTIHRSTLKDGSKTLERGRPRSGSARLVPVWMSVLAAALEIRPSQSAIAKWVMW